jgi:hypothetical protein
MSTTKKKSSGKYLFEFHSIFTAKKSLVTPKKTVDVSDLNDDEIDKLLTKSIMDQSRMNRTMMLKSKSHKKMKRPLTFAQ